MKGGMSNTALLFWQKYSLFYKIYTHALRSSREKVFMQRIFNVFFLKKFVKWLAFAVEHKVLQLKPSRFQAMFKYLMIWAKKNY